MTTPEGPSQPEEPDFSPDAMQQQLDDAQMASNLPWSRFEADNPEAAYRLGILMTPEHKDAQARAQKQLRYSSRQARKPVMGLSAAYTTAGLWATNASIEGGEIIQKSTAGMVIFGLVSAVGLRLCARDLQTWPKRKERAEQERQFYQQFFGDSGNDTGVVE
jgi:hypothetical protein